VSFSRDDLRTAAKRSSFRGGCGRGTAREHREDGADDNICENGRAKSLSFWGEEQRNAGGRKEKTQCLCGMGGGLTSSQPLASFIDAGSSFTLTPAFFVVCAMPHSLTEVKA